MGRRRRTDTRRQIDIDLILSLWSRSHDNGAARQLGDAIDLFLRFPLLLAPTLVPGPEESLTLMSACFCFVTVIGP